jgi:hypothetical protein
MNFCRFCIATRYELHGPGIESQWRQDFLHPSDRHWAPPALLYNGHRFLGVKRPGCGVNDPPPSSAEVRDTVELYLYSPSRLSWLVLGRTFPSIESTNANTLLLYEVLRNMTDSDCIICKCNNPVPTVVTGMSQSWRDAEGQYGIPPLW